MSIRKILSLFESDYKSFKLQAALTSESWRDNVQRKFYDEFIESSTKEFSTFIVELEKIDRIFLEAENVIARLKEHMN